jgi:hypothetical protein
MLLLQIAHFMEIKELKRGENCPADLKATTQRYTRLKELIRKQKSTQTGQLNMYGFSPIV